MTQDIPLWVAILVAILLVGGAMLTFVGVIGLTVFKTFYDRLHAPAIGTTWGIGALILASIFYSSFTAHDLILHELLLTVFLVVTMPVTIMLLTRAAVQRDEKQVLKKLLRKTTKDSEKKDEA